MKKERVTVKLPEGTYQTEVLVFDNSDKRTLYKIYQDWRSLCDSLAKLDARTINLPEGLSESAFCVVMNVVRVNTEFRRVGHNILGRIGAPQRVHTSFDCFDIKTNERIQVKACSVIPDLTSFGPESVWDKLYFVDFYRTGKWDGTFDIYLINNDDIYNHKVNATQTMRDQQREGRRPRFSIYSEIIKAKKLKPIKTGSLRI